MREDALANKADQAADKNARADQKGVLASAGGCLAPCCGLLARRFTSGCADWNLRLARDHARIIALRSLKGFRLCAGRRSFALDSGARVPGGRSHFLLGFTDCARIGFRLWVHL